MRVFSTLLLCSIAISASSQQSSINNDKGKTKLNKQPEKTFIISASTNAPLRYDRLATLGLSDGKDKEELYGPEKSCFERNNGYQSYQKRNNKEVDSLKMPMGGSIAGMAYDYKSNRLFYIPQQLSELRYMDLKESSPSFTYLGNQPLNLLHNPNDIANQVSRMTIGADGFGYALTNDGEHLIKFSTEGTPTIQDLGVLIDNPKNQVLVRSSCTSWGGDMVGDKDGNLYLITAYNHVFKISLPSKKCDYIGKIGKLPEGFSANGASVDENGELMISCGSTYGKNFSPIYKVNFPSLEAESLQKKFRDVDNVSDMASSNLLFQQKEREFDKSGTSNVGFTQTIETNENNLPGIRIYPNPVSNLNGRIQIRTTHLADKGEYKMMLLDVTGKSVMEGRMHISGKTNTHSFNIPVQQAKGVYIIQISDVFNRTIFSQQLILE